MNFALSGSMVAIKKQLDLLGVIILGVTTAVGGGMLRDIIMGNMPPTLFKDPIYVFLAFITVLFLFFIIRLKQSILAKRSIETYEKILNIFDAIGLGAFTVVGIDTAVLAGYGEYHFLIIFLGVITARRCFRCHRNPPPGSQVLLEFTYSDQIITLSGRTFMNRFFQYTIGILFTVCLMAVLLFTSVEAAVYWLPGYFQKEYQKYHVTQAVSMNMEDLLDVTDQMMAYLRGKREDLHVETTMGGVKREFFNEREIAHMEDVRGLFLGAVSIRRGSLMIMALCLILLLLLKTDFKRIFPRAVCAGTGLLLAVFVLLAAIISTDFNRYFIMFHHLFFRNDLWMLDPSTDMLINIVPEGFFRDTVFNIGLIFFTSVLLIITICLVIMHRYRKNDK